MDMYIILTHPPNQLIVFNITGNAVSLGLPPALEKWTNEQSLKFVSFMWNQMRQEQEEHSMDKELDPLNLLLSAEADKQTTGPLDPATVVAVAKRTFESLGPNGDELFGRGDGTECAVSFESPLTADAVIMEGNGTYVPSNPQSAQLESDHDNPQPQSPPIPGDLFLTQSQPVVSALDAATKKKRIVKWLCQNIQHLNELSNLPFNSAELWRLHQHFFSPTIQLDCWQNENGTIVGSANGIKSFDSMPPPGCSILSSPCVASPFADSPTVPSSEPVMHGKMSMLKRKVSYRFLGEATITASSSVPAPLSTIDQSVSKLIQDLNVQSMQPKTKRARRNRSRVSLVPRIKQKLDSFLDRDHQTALGVMRQLHYVEKALLNGSIYPVEELGTATHLIGALASDAETILLDML